MILNVSTVNAAICGTQHSRFQDNVIHVSYSDVGSEKVVTGQDPTTGALIYEWCYIKLKKEFHEVYCGVCGAFVVEYNTYAYYHSVKH